MTQESYTERMDALEKEVQELKELVEKTKRNVTIEQFIKGLTLLGYSLTLTSIDTKATEGGFSDDTRGQ